MRRCLLILLSLNLMGCTQQISEIGREPSLSPVGQGLKNDNAVLPLSAFPGAQMPPVSNSLWTNARGDLFRDQRARRPGDVITVNISINDKASLGNSTDRSRDASITNSLDFAFDLLHLKKNGTVKWDEAATSSTKGQGNIDRSEKIQLSIAAIVTGALPNGNLVIAGTQEIRVNYELRVLDISGIVRPSDIARDNTISYDKIAEARVSYGGRGRLSEFQQPAWGQQVYDTLSPF